MRKEYKISSHAQLQMLERSITNDMLWLTIHEPDKVIHEIEDDIIYQRLFVLNTKQFLIRVFVNEVKVPAIIKTVYLTSKIKKYLS